MNTRTRKLALAAVVAVTLIVAGGSTAMAGGCYVGGYGGYGGYGGGYGGYSCYSGYNYGTSYCFGGYNYGTCYNTYARCTPWYYQGYCLPQLGFTSCSIYGVGERVTYVHPNSIAWCMGLRCGDVILAVNGCPITCRNDWYAAYYQALCNGGYLELTVRQHCGTICTLSYQFACTPGVAYVGP